MSPNPEMFSLTPEVLSVVCVDAHGESTSWKSTFVSRPILKFNGAI
jgi:hypothetical protein